MPNFGMGVERFGGYSSTNCERTIRVSVTSLPHGRAALELRALFEAGELNDVASMTRDGGPGIFTDRKDMRTGSPRSRQLVGGRSLRY